MKALHLKYQNDQFGYTIDRKPVKRPDYNDRDYNLNASSESVVHIGKDSNENSRGVKDLEKEILRDNMKEAAKRERRPNSPRRTEEKPEEGYFIGSNDIPEGRDRHIMRLKYKAQLDEDTSYKSLNRYKSAYLDTQKAGIVYSMSEDNELERAKKMKEYRDALQQQRLEQEEKKKQENHMNKFGKPQMSKYVSASKYYG